MKHALTLALAAALVAITLVPWADAAEDKPRIAVLQFDNKANVSWWYSNGAAAAQDVFGHLTDDILLYGLIEKARNPEDYHVVGENLSYDPYALMVPQNDSRYRLVVNRTLAELFRTGEIEEIYAQWFEPMGVPLSEQLAAAFEIHALPK